MLLNGWGLLVRMASKAPTKLLPLCDSSTFLGTTYKDVECIIDDRTDKTTKVLINQDLMNRLNVMVNPSRKYIVTTKFTIEKEK